MITRDYTGVSYWLETCGDDLTPRPALRGSIDVDVAILGAGYTGLWTAYYLQEYDPSLRIAIVEKEIAGFGASGRNGAWCTASFPLGVSEMASRFGRDAAVSVAQQMQLSVDEIYRVSQAEGFDIEWAQGGSLRLARGPEQLPSIESAMKTYEHFGLAEGARLLNREETDARVKIAGVLGSLYTPHGATIHPAKLVRGLARAVERRGATIYEQTEATGYSEGAYPALHTVHGHVRAKMVVLAGESYLSRLPQIGRRVMPVYSLITLTEPLSPSDWEQIGWEQRELVGSSRFTVDYLSKTSDGRILFGGRGAPYHFRSKISDAFDRHPETHGMLQNNVRTWFPMLADVRFTHTWGGPLGWSRDYLPTMRFNRASNIAIAGGYTGTGVGTTNLAGRTLADQMLGRDTELSHLPMAQHDLRPWEPEPFRFIGVRAVQREFMRLDLRAARTGKPSSGRSLAERLTRH